jgi:hypothetical protein
MIKVGDFVHGYFWSQKVGLVIQLGGAPVMWDDDVALVAFTDGTQSWELVHQLRKVED